MATTTRSLMNSPLIFRSSETEGDAVIIRPSRYCELCHYCRIGKTHCCENAYVIGGDGPNDVRPGSFAEYTLVAANMLYHKPKNIGFDAACRTEPFSSAWKGMIHYSETEVGDDVGVISPGGIGMCCLMVAKAAGADRLIAVDVSDCALSLAKQLGAAHTVNPSQGDIRAAIYDILP